MNDFITYNALSKINTLIESTFNGKGINLKYNKIESFKCEPFCTYDNMDDIIISITPLITTNSLSLSALKKSVIDFDYNTDSFVIQRIK